MNVFQRVSISFIHVNKHSYMRKVVGSKLEYAYWKACTDNNNALV